MVVAGAKVDHGVAHPGPVPRWKRVAVNEKTVRLLDKMTDKLATKLADKVVNTLATRLADRIAERIVSHQRVAE